MAGRLTGIEPFEVRIAPEGVADLRERLRRTRWPDQPPGAGWTYGTDRDTLRDLCAYWANDFDWAAFQARLNRFAQFRMSLEDRALHFYHLRSGRNDAPALLLAHGWPGGSAEFLDVMESLSERFHLVIPSLPGFGFSGPVAAMGYRIRHAAADVAALMATLGYPNYFVHGGDKGTRLALTLAADHPDRVRALHLSLLPAPPPDPGHREAGLSDEDRRRLHRNDAFLREESAYQAVQRTKPQSLAYGLMDSPAGLAGWLIEKFRSWTDCGGDLERAMPRDRLLDMISVYWFSGTVGSSMRSYFEDGGPGRQEPLPHVTTPVGHTAFPAEIIQTPRAWAERVYRIFYWSEAPRGGHFPALEVPDLFAAELKACFDSLP